MLEFITPRVARYSTFSLCTVACCLALACGTGGRAFVARRASIEVIEGPLCDAGVIDHRTCRPRDFGGRRWERFSDFPPFTMSEYGSRGSVHLLAAEIRAHYLGSLYYHRDVHSYCKHSFGFDIFRA